MDRRGRDGGWICVHAGRGRGFWNIGRRSGQSSEEERKAAVFCLRWVEGSKLIWCCYVTVIIVRHNQISFGRTRVDRDGEREIERLPLQTHLWNCQCVSIQYMYIFFFHHTVRLLLQGHTAQEAVSWEFRQSSGARCELQSIKHLQSSIFIKETDLRSTWCDVTKHSDMVLFIRCFKKLSIVCVGLALSSYLKVEGESWSCMINRDVLFRAARFGRRKISFPGCSAKSSLLHVFSQSWSSASWVVTRERSSSLIFHLLTRLQQAFWK